MPKFELNQPITTETPVITVDAGLHPGRYRFRLVVVDQAGNRSEPVEREVIIRH